MAISSWVTLQVWNHLEEILIARSGAAGFGLLDNNSVETNIQIFQAATYLSTYLHLFHIPQSPGDQLVSLFIETGPIINKYYFTANPICLHESSPPLCHSRCILQLDHIYCTSHLSTIFEVPLADTQLNYHGVQLEGRDSSKCICRVPHGYGNTRGVSKTGNTGTGTVVDFGTPRHTVYLYPQLRVFHGYITTGWA